jgi:hypothetical protein
MLSGFSNIFTPSNSKPTENQNQQTQPKAEEQGQAQGPSSQNNSTGSQNAGSASATQAPSATSGQSGATLNAQTTQASMVEVENDEGTSSFNEAAYMRRVAERVQAEMALNSIFNIKDESNVVPSLFASATQESEPSNKAALKEYMKNSEPA